MKLRRLREGDVLDDGGITLVRGGCTSPSCQDHWKKNRHLSIRAPA